MQCKIIFEIFSKNFENIFEPVSHIILGLKIAIVDFEKSF